MPQTQNWKRNSSDRMRGPLSLVYCPVDALVFAPVAGLNVNDVLMPLNSVWLKTLNASTLNLSRRFSLPMGIDLESDASKLIHPGPYIMLVPAFPMVPTAGSANAAGLKASLPLGSPAPVGTLAKGFPTTSMRAPSLVDPVISSPFVVVKLGVNGPPLLAVVIPDICQLSAMALRNLLCIACPGLGKS